MSKKISLFSKILPLAAIAMAVSLSGAKCQEPPPQLDDTPAVDESDESVAIGRGDCAHAYYPLTAGYSLTYRAVNGDRTDEYSMTVTEADGSSATLKFSFAPDDRSEPATFNQQLTCSDGNLTPDGYLDMSSRFGDYRVRLDTDNVEGVLLPHSLDTGASWVTTYDLTVTPEGGDYPMVQFGQMKSRVSASSTVEGLEEVTVPAGDFEAYKVRVDTITTTEIPNLPGNVPPTETEVVSYQWYAEGVGLVKMENADGTSVTEAVEVSRP